MQRRTFLTGTIGCLAYTTGLGSGRVAAAPKPCPPSFDGSNAVSCPTSGLLLSEAASSLQAGGSVSFTENTLQHSYDIQWQVQTIWYDNNRRELQYMGKPASSQSENYSHYIYDESSDTWSTTGQSLFPGLGHVWNVTFDPVNGDYWFRKYNSNVLYWFDRSDGTRGTWKQTASQSSPALNSGNANFAAMGWHPNLFGPGNPGLFIWAVFRFFAYNLSTRTFSVMSPSDFSGSGPYWNRPNGQALYVPETDQLICFAKDSGNGHPAILVDAGAGASSDVLTDGFVRTASQPPIQVFGGGGTSNHGHVVNHPNNANRLLLLDEHGTSRVWESSDKGQSWQLQSYTHPFQEMHNRSSGEYTVGIISEYGVVIGMTSNENGGETILWKPNA